MRRAPTSLVHVLPFLALASGCMAEADDGTAGAGDALRIELDEAATPRFQEGRIFGVSGRVEGGATTVRIDDQVVRLDADGRFSYTEAVAPGAHRVRIRAGSAESEVGTYAAAIVGDFRTADEPVHEAAAIELGADALDALGRGASDLVARQDLNAALAARNPVLSDTWGSVSVTNVAHGAVDVTLRSEGGKLVVDVAIHDLQVGIGISTSSLGDIAGQLTSQTTRVEAPLTLGMEAGHPSVGLDGTTIAFDGFAFDVDRLPTSLESNDIIRDVVRTQLEETLQQKIGELAPGFVQTALASLPVTGEIDVRGASLAYDVGIASLAVTPAGLAASVDVGVRAANPVAGRDHGALVLDHGLAPMTGTPGVGLSVSVDALNEAAMAAWAAGLLEIDLPRVPLGETELSTSALTLISGRLARRVAPDLPLAAHVSLGLPPVARVRDDGALEVQLADVLLELLAAPEGGNPEHLLTVSVGAQVAISTRVEGGAIVPVIGDLVVTIDGVDARPDEADSLAELVHGLLVPRLGALLDFGGLRLPALRGFQITAEQLRTQNGYVRFVGSLDYVGADPAR